MPVATHPRKSYTEKEIELALQAVAFLNGNTSQAHRDLKTAGLSIDPKTLWRWSRQQHVERYETIRSEVTPKAREWAAEEHMAIAAEQMDVTRDLTKLAKAKAGDIPARDLPGAVRNMSTAAAVETDKAQLLGGQPTVRVERDASEVLRKLKARGVVIDAEVLEEEDVTDAPSLDAGN